jgi:hypothetical protein
MRDDGGRKKNRIYFTISEINNIEEHTKMLGIGIKKKHIE